MNTYVVIAVERLVVLADSEEEAKEKAGKLVTIHINDKQSWKDFEAWCVNEEEAKKKAFEETT